MIPGSAVRLTSVARHVTDCATWPGIDFRYCLTHVIHDMSFHSGSPNLKKFKRHLLDCMSDPKIFMTNGSLIGEHSAILLTCIKR